MQARKTLTTQFGLSSTACVPIKSQALPYLVVVVWLAFIVTSLATPNPLISVIGLMVPYAVYRLLHRPGHPQILLFGAIFQWSSVYGAVLQSNLSGLTITEAFGGGELERAIWLSYIAVIALSAGMAVVIRFYSRASSSTQINQESKRICVKRLFFGYLVFLLASVALTWISSRAGNLRQPILAFASIKWVPVFLLAWTTIQHKRNSIPLLIVLGCEVAIGFFGYFSHFKEALFLAIVVVMGTSIRGKLRLKPIIAICTLTILLASFWQTIKGDYRNFLNQNTGQQIIVVGVFDRIEFLLNAAFETTPSNLLEGTISGVSRLAYVDYFAYALRHVPAAEPHQDGGLWMGAAAHTFMPRIFFPDKQIINESQITERFTGIRVAGREQGTSVSLGYPAESYVDFGVPVMFVPIFVLGVLFGFIYECLGQKKNGIFGVACGSSVLLTHITMFGASCTSLVGGLTTGFIAFAILVTFGGKYLYSYFVAEGQS